MIDLILAPLQYAFMVRGMIAAILVGTVCATVGAYVILRGMAFFGDALAHAILPGVAVGYLVGGGAREPLFWWSRSTKIREDTAIGIVFAGMFALGVALISTVRSYTADLAHFLFGDVLGVRNADLTLIAVFGGLILLVIVAFYKEFLVLSFDPVLATTLRLPVRLLDFMQIVLIAVAIVVSIQTVGVALMLAMLVTPAASAYLLTRNLPVMMVLAALVASISGVIGLYLSFYLNIASGAAIVLTCTAIFALIWLVQTVRQRFLA